MLRQGAEFGYLYNCLESPLPCPDEVQWSGVLSGQLLASTWWEPLSADQPVCTCGGLCGYRWCAGMLAGWGTWGNQAPILTSSPFLL